MKILIVINDYYNKSNGMSISTQRFVNEFRKAGQEVRVITNNKYGDFDYPLPCLSIPFFNGIIEKEGYTFAKPVKRVIKEAVEWADVIHVEDPFFVCRKATIYAKKLGKPVTGAFHLYPENMTYAFGVADSKFWGNFLMNSFHKMVYHRCDYIQCPTKYVKERLEEYSLPAELEVISNGIDAKFFEGERTFSADDSLNVLSIGRYAPEKRQDILIKAIARSKYKDKIHLTLAGAGLTEPELRKCAAECGIEPTFEFYSQEDLQKVMLKNDVYVHCAEIEVEGMSCMEAFASGCVPIISDAHLSSTRAYSLEDVNAFPKNDVEELAKRIDYFFENRDELRRLSDKYREFARGLDVAKSAERVIDMMERAIA